MRLHITLPLVFITAVLMTHAAAAQPPAPNVDTRSREAVADFYHSAYENSTPPAINFTGNVGSCQPGNTSAAYKAEIARRINFFRAMAGVPAVITLSDAYNSDAQAAALMMSANGSLSHTPPATWRCYTASGATGAGSGNLFLGVNGWDAIDGYIDDPGDGNSFVGHRRWILHPPTQQMGTGDIPESGGFWPANSLRVFDDHIWDTRPATRDDFVAWPPPGFLPYQLAVSKWSLSLADADFSHAAVRMTLNGAAIAVNQAPVVNGFGENTLVWQPQNPASLGGRIKPASDLRYAVSVSNVTVNGTLRSFAYDVTVADLSVLGAAKFPTRVFIPLALDGG